MCRSCYRNNRYCCEICQTKGNRKRHQEAQERYRNKIGREVLNEIERGRRYNKWLENQILARLARARGSVGNVDGDIDIDQGIADEAKTDVVELFLNASLDIRSLIRDGKVSKAKRAMGTKGRCVFCGCKGLIVEKFPRRGYGSRRS